MGLNERLLDLSTETEAVLAEMAEKGVSERIWLRDHTVWSNSTTEITDRLGWLDAPQAMLANVDELETFAGGVHTDGLRDAVVLGMGGSSLFPEVLSETFAVADGRVPVGIVDTTDPATVAAVGSTDGRALEEILFVAASKSGTTIETRSALSTYWAKLQRGSQFCTVTDPGSELVAVSESDGYRRTFLNPADIGGRFAALSYFGLLPGALAGAPIGPLLSRATDALGEYRRAAEDSDAFRRGVAMAVASRAGRDKLTVMCDPRIAAFGDWLEQLVAESTGKAGVGIVPIVDEPVQPSTYGDDRFFVVIGERPELASLDDHPTIHVPLADELDLGRQVVLWELATAVAGAVLGINPFDQPDVASAKAATNQVLANGLPQINVHSLEELTAQVRPGDYVAICAYVDPWSPTVPALKAARQRIGAELSVATTLGIGPRYLHSTGQLHKGKPDRVVVIQTISEDANDVAIPGQRFGFSTLKAAQAAGDLQSLSAKGVRGGRVALSELIGD